MLLDARLKFILPGPACWKPLLDNDYGLIERLLILSLLG